jgi:ATP-dependent Clp protease ATP-binding subunit ClpC
MGSDERAALSNLEERISSKVIGQEEAVSETAKTVKRQRVGIGKHGKPSVMMFIGNSGTGKTYLAKTLAAEVFGDEAAFIRLDMSEYSDKTSVNKITGSSPGYIGYDKGGILTEAVKKRSHCVLLLDEMEKADDIVFDVFLQLFDDGRLTDNKGTTVDFSNVIVIMTSNVGAREATLRGSGVGFIKSESMTEDIIKNELRKKFKPEFINRIDNIIMFNNLTNDNLKQIIKNEMNSFVGRLRDLKFDIDDEFLDKANEHVYSELIKENENKDFGARPILRLIRREIEDKITDFIIDKNPENGYVFSFNDIS